MKANETLHPTIARVVENIEKVLSANEMSPY